MHPPTKFPVTVPHVHVAQNVASVGETYDDLSTAPDKVGSVDILHHQVGATGNEGSSTLVVLFVSARQERVAILRCSAFATAWNATTSNPPFAFEATHSFDDVFDASHDADADNTCEKEGAIQDEFTRVVAGQYFHVFS